MTDSRSHRNLDYSQFRLQRLQIIHFVYALFCKHLESAKLEFVTCWMLSVTDFQNCLMTSKKSGQEHQCVDFFKSNLLVPAVHSLPCQSSSFKFYLTRDSRGPELSHWWIMFLNRGKGLRVGNSNSKKHLKLLLSYKKWGLNAPMMKVQDSKQMKPTVAVGWFWDHFSTYDPTYIRKSHAVFSKCLLKYTKSADGKIIDGDCIIWENRCIIWPMQNHEPTS